MAFLFRGTNRVLISPFNEELTPVCTGKMPIYPSSHCAVYCLACVCVRATARELVLNRFINKRECCSCDTKHTNVIFGNQINFHVKPHTVDITYKYMNWYADTYWEHHTYAYVRLTQAETPCQKRIMRATTRVIFWEIEMKLNSWYGAKRGHTD